MNDKPMTVAELVAKASRAAVEKSTPEERSARARKAAIARWRKYKKGKKPAKKSG